VPTPPPPPPPLPPPRRSRVESAVYHPPVIHDVQVLTSTSSLSTSSPRVFSPRPSRSFDPAST
jgi:hypothetical protein